MPMTQEHSQNMNAGDTFWKCHKMINFYNVSQTTGKNKTYGKQLVTWLMPRSRGRNT